MFGAREWWRQEVHEGGLHKECTRLNGLLQGPWRGQEVSEGGLHQECTRQNLSSKQVQSILKLHVLSKAFTQLLTGSVKCPKNEYRLRALD